ncbi:MAG: hypothetical protein HY554_06415, partial [Elusimicrobia bacterium]|nr:hypothetical protein [Elusimicrobiota bacterium]
TVTGRIEVIFTASDDRPGALIVELLVDGSLVSSTSINPRFEPVARFSWDSAVGPAGRRALRIRVRDAENETLTEEVEVFVRRGGAPPRVRIVSPADGAHLSGKILFVLEASDDEGLAGVQLEAEGSILSDRLTQPPFRWDLDTAAWLGRGVDRRFEIVARAWDQWGNEARQAIGVRIDNRAPTISNAGVNPTPDGQGLVVRWNTDEPATSELEYENGGGRGRLQDAGSRTSHERVISGVLAGAKVRLWAVSRDAVENEGRSDAMEFEAPRAAPEIADTSAEVMPSSVTITWRTREPASCVLRLGIQGQPADDLGSIGQNFQSDFRISAKNLIEGEAYQFELRCVDRKWNEAKAGPFGFIVAPRVGLIAPVAGSRLSGEVHLRAEAWSRESLVSVRFLADGETVGPELTESPFELVLDTARTLREGPCRLAVKALDAAGRERNSEEVEVFVDNQPPKVSIETPGSEAYLANPIRIWAAAEDSSGIKRVVAKDAAGRITELERHEKSSRFHGELRLDPGAQTVFVQAEDRAGRVAEANIRVWVDGGPPRLRIVSPAAGETVRGILGVELEAVDDLRLRTVQFFVDSTESRPVAWQQDLEAWAPGQPRAVRLPWDTRSLEDGRHRIFALVHDGVGNSAWAEPIDVETENASVEPPGAPVLTAAGPFTLSVAWGAAEAGRILAYRLEVALDADFSKPLPGYSKRPRGGGAAEIGGLEPETRYYVRLRSLDRKGRVSPPGPAASLATQPRRSVPVGDAEAAIPDPAIGATVEAGAVRLKVAPASLEEGVTITIEALAEAQTPPVRAGRRAGAARRFGPAGLRFAHPALVSLPYAPGDGVAVVHYFDPTRNAWEPVAGSVADDATRIVSAPIGHFSIYAVVMVPQDRLVASADITETYAFPNPLKGTRATVRAELSSAADRVEARVYSLGGEVVEQVELNGRPSGFGAVRYEGPVGAGLPSGVYTVVVSATSQAQNVSLRKTRLAISR